MTAKDNSVYCPKGGEVVLTESSVHGTGAAAIFIISHEVGHKVLHRRGELQGLDPNDKNVQRAREDSASCLAGIAMSNLHPDLVPMVSIGSTPDGIYGKPGEQNNAFNHGAAFADCPTVKQVATQPYFQ